MDAIAPYRQFYPTTVGLWFKWLITKQIPNFQVFLELVAAFNTFGLVSNPISQEINTGLAETEKELLHEKGGDIHLMLNELQADLSPKLQGLLTSQNVP